MLFLIIFFWTPPHFWALSLWRAGDYARAGVPMLPVVAGEAETRRQIMVYALMLAPLGVVPWLAGYSGSLYGAVSLVAQMTYDAPTEDRTLRADLQRALAKFGLDKDATAPTVPIVGHPVFIAAPKSYQNLRWIQAVQTLNGSGPNRKGKYKSAYMRKDFPDDQINAIYKYLTWKPPSDAIDMSQ